MLKLLFTGVLGLTALSGRPQSIVDLTEQLALDVQKLASLKSTLQEMYTGYTDLKNGYTRIRDLAKDNFNLHAAFLDALWVLSPVVRNDPQLEEILNTAYRIATEYKAANIQLGNTPVFTAQELAYITGTLAALLDHCNQALEQLTMITTDNELRMSDAQRLQALHSIDGEVKTQLSFLQQFNNSLAVEAARRQREANDINTLKQLYGLPTSDLR